VIVSRKTYNLVNLGGPFDRHFDCGVEVRECEDLRFLKSASEIKRGLERALE